MGSEEIIYKAGQEPVNADNSGQSNETVNTVIGGGTDIEGENSESQIEVFPTVANEDGYYYASKEEKDMGVETKDYENGSKTKRLYTSEGKEVVIRKLKGRDFIETKASLAGLKPAQAQKMFEVTNMALATKIAGQGQPPEYYMDDLYQSDYSTIYAAYQLLNF